MMRQASPTHPVPFPNENRATTNFDVMKNLERLESVANFEDK